MHNDIGTLVTAGEYDPVTPVRWSKLAQRTLPNSFYVEMPRGGHGVTFEDECGERMVRAFLNRPDKRPATSCMEDEYYPFVFDGAKLPQAAIPRRGMYAHRTTYTVPGSPPFTLPTSCLVGRASH